MVGTWMIEPSLSNIDWQIDSGNKNQLNSNRPLNDHT